MRTTALILSALLTFATLEANAATVVSTDFSGRLVAGDTASNITYTLNGLADPGNLTATGPAALAGLFNSPEAQGRFAPNLNTDTEGNWSVSVPLVLTAQNVVVSQVELDGNMFTNSGGFQTVIRDTDVVVSFVGSTSGTVSMQTANVSNPGGPASAANSGWSNTYKLSGAAVLLSNSETWQMVVNTTGCCPAGAGNNTGLDAFTVDGAASDDTVLLFTDFEDRSVAGSTASNLNWLTSGIADPGSLTASQPLFNTTDAQDKFVVDRNLGSEGPWDVSVPLAIGSEKLALGTISMDVFIFNNDGDLQTQNRDVDIQVELLDSGLSVLDTVSVLDIYPSAGTANQPQTALFDFSGNILNPNTNYSLRITASNSGDGNNAGLGNLLVGGRVVPPAPEPASLALYGIAVTLAAAWVPRRRCRPVR